MVPNRYTLLSEIPEQAKYFSVIDLKDAFYSVPLVEESQFLFAFEDPTQPASQLTWTVLPQGFHDSPHLSGFLGITGYCRIWFPGYGELAGPLYKLIAETQQAQTDKLVWSPDTQKAFKVLQTALLQAPALSVPTGSEFNLSLKEKAWPWEF